jgi:colanic acid/amylovoran biosynthesis glycosyltransferase
MMPAPSKPTVLLFKETLLPLSETFIEAQARELSCFVARYAGLGRVTPSLGIPPDSILLTSDISTSARLIQKVYRRLGVAPTFHGKAYRARPHLLHAHFASGGRSALPLSRYLQVPLIVTLHGSDITMRTDYASRYRELWNESSLFICVSDFIRKKAVEAGFPENKLLVHYIGVDLEIFRPRLEQKRRELVLFVGRLVEKKGCAFLLKAMAEVKRSHPSAQTVVLGDGPLRPTLEKLAADLGIPCQFLGAQAVPVVRHWLSVARLLCTPSVTARNGDSEGLGMVFAEAQAMGTPVVSFQHGGIPEVVLHGETGLLAPEGDSHKLAEYLVQLLENDQIWQQFAKRGISWVQKQFNLKPQTRQLEAIYQQVCRPAQNMSCQQDWRSEPAQIVAT